MAATNTLEIDLNFFLTPKGKEFKDAYKEWKNRQQEDGTMTALREELAQDGLLNKKVSGRIRDRVKAVFEEQDGLTMEEILEAVNGLLEKEGNWEQCTLASLRGSLNFGITLDRVDRKTGEVKERAFLRVEEGEEGEDGKKAPSKYFKRHDAEEEETAELATATGKGKPAKKGGK
jgi:hypothetical protein